MNIYAKPGSKVVLATLDAGYDHQKKFVEENLKLGETYTVKKTEAHDWYTNVWLEEVPGVFNSVFFEDSE